MTENYLHNIDTTFESYHQIINLYHSNNDKLLDTINVTFSKWFAANLSAVIGAIFDKFQLDLNTIKMTMPEDIQRILQKNNFLSHYGYPKIFDSNQTTIEYQKLKPTDGKFFQQYIFEELLGRSELPLITAPLKKKITESIYEMFINAQIHSNTQYIYTCGQFFPLKNKIEFTIVDTGDGFKNKINSSLNVNFSSTQAIAWALRDGNTTKKGIPGGIGLSLLREFVIQNRGKIQIISDNGFYQYDTEGEQFQVFTAPFPGTIINMQFRTDDTNAYNIESDNNDIF